MSISALGLLLDISGVVLIILADLFSVAAQIYHHKGKIEGGFFKRDAIKFAKKYASKDPLDQVENLTDTITLRLWVFVLIFLGFALQFIGANLKSLTLF